MLSLYSETNIHDPLSMASRLRARRFQVFEALIAGFPRPLNILDIGGTREFWAAQGWIGREDVHITTVNLSGPEVVEANFEARVGDATDLSEIADNQFDIAFSNSVIEHLFTFDKQKKMAEETRRVAKAYWVQTPNYWFPIEPHFLMPGWQWLPRELRIAIVRRFRCGWEGPYPEIKEATRAVDSIRLLSGGELRELFPGARIWKEKFGGLTKSLVAFDAPGLGLGANIAPQRQSERSSAVRAPSPRGFGFPSPVHRKSPVTR